MNRLAFSIMRCPVKTGLRGGGILVCILLFAVQTVWGSEAYAEESRRSTELDEHVRALLRGLNSKDERVQRASIMGALELGAPARDQLVEMMRTGALEMNDRLRRLFVSGGRSWLIVLANGGVDMPREARIWARTSLGLVSWKRWGTPSEEIVRQVASRLEGHGVHSSGSSVPKQLAELGRAIVPILLGYLDPSDADDMSLFAAREYAADTLPLLLDRDDIPALRSLCDRGWDLLYAIVLRIDYGQGVQLLGERLRAGTMSRHLQGAIRLVQDASIVEIVASRLLIDRQMHPDGSSSLLRYVSRFGAAPERERLSQALESRIRTDPRLPEDLAQRDQLERDVEWECALARLGSQPALASLLGRLRRDRVLWARLEAEVRKVVRSLLGPGLATAGTDNLSGRSLEQVLRRVRSDSAGVIWDAGSKQFVRRGAKR